jgi:hypothetical protein
MTQDGYPTCKCFIFQSASHNFMLHKHAFKYIKKNLRKVQAYESQFWIKSLISYRSVVKQKSHTTPTHTIQNTLRIFLRCKLHIFGLRWWTHVKLGPYDVGYIHWRAHHTHLKTLFYEDPSPKTHMFILMNISIIKKTHKFIVT